MKKCTGWPTCGLSGRDSLCKVYSFSSSEIEREIKRSQKLIVEYKEELKKSRVIRRHRQEYDAMAKVRCFIQPW